jgi:hypothetical protein
MVAEAEFISAEKKAQKAENDFFLLWDASLSKSNEGFYPNRPESTLGKRYYYIAIGNDFGYLSLITDAYSRKVVGFYLSKDLSAQGCIMAWKMALKNNPHRENLIHHSDRGLQYYSAGYMKLLGNICISMSENSDPLENAIAERMNGILKEELLEKLL